MTKPVNTVRKDRSRGRLPSFLLRGGLFAGLVVGVATFLIGSMATVDTVVTSLPVDSKQAPGLTLATPQVVKAEPGLRHIRIQKFSRLSKATPSEIRQAMLTPDAVKASQSRMATIALASAERAKAERARAFAIAEARIRAESQAMAQQLDVARPSLVTALVEDSPIVNDTRPRPFDLVLDTAQADAGHVLPDVGPLPGSRPERRAKPAAQATALARETPAAEREIAYAKPNKSLFDGIFGGNKDRWPGIGTKVAIYDVSGAKVYMPDGTILEAHSGIGEMRDKPQFAHVKMRGPTPAGTYKVTMREALFHGVEAVRLTPTNGVAPLGRVGLLAHSYLLRKRGDSHGCVAFADYPKFLKAFKRGHITTMVIVNSMPKSRTQVAALYRRGV